MLTVIAIVGAIVVVVGLNIIPLVIDTKNILKRQGEYKKLFNIKELGICNNCDYGFDNCLKDGKAKCLEEEQNGKKKSF